MKVMAWLISFLGVLNPSYAADTISPIFKLTLVFGAALWVALIVVAAGWSAYSFSIGNFSTVLPLKFLRATARLTTTALFVPLASLLISVYKCKKGDRWNYSDIGCYSVEHSLLMAMVSILLPCFWIFSLCVSAVFFDRNYRSSNITARTHGRVGILMISIKSSLTLIFTVAQDADPWFLHVVVIGLGLFWLYLYLRFLPNFTQWMNQVWSAFGSVFLWAGLCAALARTLNNPYAGVAGYVFFIGVPTAAYTGYALAFMRFQSFGRVGLPGGPIMRSPYDVELRARYILRDVMAAGRAHDHRGHKAVHAHHHDNPDAHHDGMDMYGEHDDQHRSHHHHHSTGASSGRSGNISGRVIRSRNVELTAQEEANAIAEVAALYDRAEQIFPNSAVLCLFHAQFMRCFLNDKDRELQIINQGLTKDPSVDIRFLLFQSRRQLEEQSSIIMGPAASQAHTGGLHNKHGHGKQGHGKHGHKHGHGGKLSLIEMVQFEKLLSESTDFSLKARTCEHAFWMALRATSPELARLHYLAEEMSNNIARATLAFEKLLMMQPDSVEVLQSYAIFLLEVKRETVAANKYFDQADEITAQREAAAAAATAAIARKEEEIKMKAEADAKAREDAQNVIYLLSSPNSVASKGSSRRAISEGPDTARSRGTTNSRSMGFAGNRGGLTSYSQTPTVGGNPPEITKVTLGQHAENDIDAQLLNKAKRRGSQAVAAYAAAVGKVRRQSLVVTNAETITQHEDRKAHWTLNSPVGSGPGTSDAQTGRNTGKPPLPTPSNTARGRRSEKGSRQSSQSTPRNKSQMQHNNSNHQSHATPSTADRGRKSERKGHKTPSTTPKSQPQDESFYSPNSNPRNPRSTSVPAYFPSRTDIQLLRGFPADKIQNERDLRRRQDADRAALQQEEAKERAAAEEAEKAALESARRRAAFSERAKEEARRRRQDAAEAAATSLRLAITTRASVMEPSLIALVRAITIFFVSAALINVIAAGLQRWLYDGITSGMDLFELSNTRSLMVEDVVHATSQLSYFAAGYLPYNGAVLNATYNKLISSSSKLDEIHRQLYLATGTAVTSQDYEAAYYNEATLVIQDISFTSSGVTVITPRLISLSNLGIEFVSKAALVYSLPLINITMDNPSVWFILMNGPGSVRVGMNTSTIYLAQGIAAHDARIRIIDLAVMVAAAIIFGALSIIVVLPLALIVKRDTDGIFAIFLNLPEVILQQMEITCKAQIDAIQRLESGSSANPDAALQLALQRQGINDIVVDIDSNPLEENLLDEEVDDDKQHTDDSFVEEFDEADIENGKEKTRLLNKNPTEKEKLMEAQRKEAVNLAAARAARIALQMQRAARLAINVRRVTKLTRQPSALQIIKSDQRRADLIRSVSHELLPTARIPAENEAVETTGKNSVTNENDKRLTKNSSGSFLGGSFSTGSHGGSFFGSASSNNLSDNLPPTRKFKASVFMGIRLLFRFTWPLFLLLAFYLGIWRYEDQTSTAVAGLRRDAVFFGQVNTLTTHVNHAVRTTLLDPTVICNETAIGVTVEFIDGLTSTINTYQDGVLYGTPSNIIDNDGVPFGSVMPIAPPTLSIDGSLQNIMLNDACSVPNMPNDCGSRNGFYHGLLSDGLQAALREYNLLARHILQLRQADIHKSPNTCPTYDPAADNTLGILDSLTHIYMRASFVYVVQLVVDMVHTSTSGFLTVHAILTALSVILLLSLYFIFFMRAIRKMDRDIKRTRGTLLLFPTDVLAGVAAFVHMSGAVGIGVDLVRGVGGGPNRSNDDDDYDNPPPQPRLRPNLIGRMQ